MAFRNTVICTKVKGGHQLVTHLGFKTIFLVGHDIGSQISYSYAAAHASELKRLVVIDYTFSGFAPPGIRIACSKDLGAFYLKVISSALLVYFNASTLNKIEQLILELTGYLVQFIYANNSLLF